MVKHACPLALILFSLHAPALADSTKVRTVVGVIAAYECGDNCYLTIRDKNSNEHTGLCAAHECQSWNQQAVMPKSFLGKRVQVTIESADQYDGEGNIVRQMEAFTQILFK